MHTLRWLVLLPATAAAFYLAIAATIATHYLVEQHLCPAEDFDRGICSNRTLGVILELIKHCGAALTVIAVAGVAAIIAPSHKRLVLCAALALVLLLASYFSFAGTAGSLFAAALAGGVLAAAGILRQLRPPLEAGSDKQ
jgi:hypothetical protein